MNVVERASSPRFDAVLAEKGFVRGLGARSELLRLYSVSFLLSWWNKRARGSYGGGYWRNTFKVPLQLKRREWQSYAWRIFGKSTLSRCGVERVTPKYATQVPHSKPVLEFKHTFKLGSS